MARAPAPAASQAQDAMDRAIHDARVRGWVAGGREVDGVYGLYWNSNCLWLAGAERDDAADRVVRGNPNRDAVAGNHFDAKAAHTAAQLGEHFMPGVALNSIKPSAVHRHYRSLHVDQIVFAQTGSKSFLTRELEKLWQ